MERLVIIFGLKIEARPDGYLDLKYLREQDPARAGSHGVGKLGSGEVFRKSDDSRRASKHAGGGAEWGAHAFFHKLDRREWGCLGDACALGSGACAQCGDGIARERFWKRDLWRGFRNPCVLVFRQEL